MNNDVERLEEKVKTLEESIKEFQDNHNKQVNNLIDLFSDVIDLIKNREIKSEDTKDNKLPDFDYDDYGDEYFESLEDVKILDDNYVGKSPKEILDKIIDSAKNEVEKPDNKNDDEVVKDEVKKPKKINLEDLKMDLVIDDNKNAENKQDSSILKIEKAFTPVQAWVDAFKEKDRYLKVKDIFDSYKNEEIIEEKEVESIDNIIPTNKNNVGLSSLVYLKKDSKIYNSPNLNIEEGTIDSMGYDDETPLMIMAINYVDEMTNEKITFDLYNCKTEDERTSMINAEQTYLSNNENAKVNNFCVASKNGNKIGWTSVDNLRKVIEDEMELV